MTIENVTLTLIFYFSFGLNGEAEQGHEPARLQSRPLPMRRQSKPPDAKTAVAEA